jgi:hypothetical protein
MNCKDVAEAFERKIPHANELNKIISKCGIDGIMLECAKSEKDVKDMTVSNFPALTPFHFRQILAIRSLLKEDEEKWKKDEDLAFDLRKKQEENKVQLAFEKQKKDEEKAKQLKAHKSISILINQQLRVNSVLLRTSKEFDKILTAYGLVALYDPRTNKTLISLEDIENNQTYIGMLKTDDKTLDPVQEITNINNSIRSRADYAAQRYLAAKYNVVVKFKEHDFKLTDALTGQELGDIDSLFESTTHYFIVERKRTINSRDATSILDQVRRTKAAFEDYLRRKLDTKLVVAVVFAQAVSEKIVGELIGEGIDIIQEATEFRT